MLKKMGWAGIFIVLGGLSGAVGAQNSPRVDARGQAVSYIKVARLGSTDRVVNVTRSDAAWIRSAASSDASALRKSKIPVVLTVLGILKRGVSESVLCSYASDALGDSFVVRCTFAKGTGGDLSSRIVVEGPWDELPRHIRAFIQASCSVRDDSKHGTIGRIAGVAACVGTALVAWRRSAVAKNDPELRDLQRTVGDGVADVQEGLVDGSLVLDVAEEGGKEETGGPQVVIPKLQITYPEGASIAERVAALLGHACKTYGCSTLRRFESLNFVPISKDRTVWLDALERLLAPEAEGTVLVFESGVFRGGLPGGELTVEGWLVEHVDALRQNDIKILVVHCAGHYSSKRIRGFDDRSRRLTNSIRESLRDVVFVLEDYNGFLVDVSLRRPFLIDPLAGDRPDEHLLWMSNLLGLGFAQKFGIQDTSTWEGEAGGFYYNPGRDDYRARFGDCRV